MGKINSSLSILLISISLLMACSRPVPPSGSASDVKSGKSAVPSPPCIVYKTKSDYSWNIPVILSEDKSKIVSYPDVKDVYYKGNLAYPTALNEGYLLDNRGIGPNVAFLTLTYEQFSKLKVTPSVNELFELILDKDPLLVMYNCGSRIQYADIEIELNELISSGKISSFKKLK